MKGTNVMQNNHRSILLAGVVAAILVSSRIASYATIISGATATATSTFGGRIAQNAVDGSGLTAGDNSAYTADQTHTNDNPTGTMWMTNSGGGTTAQFTVDLHAQYSVAALRIFNYNEAPGSGSTRGMKDVSLSVSANDITYTTFGSIVVPKASELNTYTGTLFDFTSLFGGPIQGRYFRLNGSSTYTVTAENIAGLSELQFEQAVPEPSTVLLLGLGGLLVWRRAKK